MSDVHERFRPLVVPALSEHRQTFILLHGRGDNAYNFGEGLLSTYIPGCEGLQEIFPHARFIFPNAPERRLIAAPSMAFPQWFDIWYGRLGDHAHTRNYQKGLRDHRSLVKTEEKSEVQVEGLQETSQLLHQLLRLEIGLVGASNIVLGGLSQGCAASMIAALTWDGEPLAAVVGMCGWLPFRSQMDGSKDSEATGPVVHDEVESQPPAVVNRDHFEAAVYFLQKKLELPSNNQRHAFKDIPTFIGHGTVDPTINVSLGKEMTSSLQYLGVQAKWHEYPTLAHWYSPFMLRDMANFIKEKNLWEKP